MAKRTWTGALVCVCVLLGVLVSPARADGAREHDGFFLRLGLGLGGLGMDRDGSVNIGNGANFFSGTSRIAGGTGVGELTIGGMLSQRLLLAGTATGQNLSTPVLERSGAADVKLAGSLHFSLLGVSLTFFPDPRSGFHVGGTVGVAWAWVKAPSPSFTEYLGGAGGAIALDAGYSWWASADWSLGVLMRLTAAQLHGEDTVLGITGAEDDRVTAVALMFSAAYN